MKRSRSDSRAKLEYYDRLLSRTILHYQVRESRTTDVGGSRLAGNRYTPHTHTQNPVTGLLPAFVFEDGTAGWAKNHAWVRDNVYSVLSIWGMAIVYRRGAESEEDRQKAYHLEQVCEGGEGTRRI